MWRSSLAVCSLAVAVLGANLQDYVPQFPWAPSNYTFGIFSGYLDVPNSGNKSLHYVFVESQNDPETDPLILWLNGGPGCSSMDGLLYEHGPFVFVGDSLNLTANPFSWNTNASVIYLEAPAGVGFSLLGNASNIYTDDAITAHDNLQALLQWFASYPEYEKNDFYIMGESYAGIYVPTLAYNVLAYNQATGRDNINLVGIAVGNGVTDYKFDNQAALANLVASHSLADFTFLSEYTAACSNSSSEACANQTNYLYSIFDDINIYDIYGDCVPSPAQLRNTPWVKKTHHMLGEVPPCVEWAGIVNYFNNSAVRAALHIPVSAPNWDFCNDAMQTTYTKNTQYGSIYTYPYLMAFNLKILIFTGDCDAAVPFTGTRQWVENLNLTTVSDFQPWYYNQQVAGFTQQYSGLTYTTVKGAGHMVPQDKPGAAHQMIYGFLNS
jgi:carboxypeptidase C (cathepsin A)